jgi:hypothetical protein
MDLTLDTIGVLKTKLSEIISSVKSLVPVDSILNAVKNLYKRTVEMDENSTLSD